MNAIEIRSSLLNLKYARDMIRNAREQLKNLEPVRALGLHEELLTIEQALNAVEDEIREELIKAGFLQA